MKYKFIYKIFILALVVLTFACKKKELEPSDVDPNAVNFVITQPSISLASFVAKCTNYNIVLDSVYFLDPNNTFYNQNFNAALYSVNEDFMIGGYTPVDGLWIIQFKGSIQVSGEAFNSSIPYNMNIENDDEE